MLSYVTAIVILTLVVNGTLTNAVYKSLAIYPRNSYREIVLHDALRTLEVFLIRLFGMTTSVEPKDLSSLLHSSHHTNRSVTVRHAAHAPWQHRVG